VAGHGGTEGGWTQSGLKKELLRLTGKGKPVASPPLRRGDRGDCEPVTGMAVDGIKRDWVGSNGIV
jgi:hypothetical protein